MGSKFYSKSERDILKFLNENLGTNHRDKPYDFNNKSDVKEQVTLLIGKFMDYRKYCMISSSLCEELDESIELHTPLTWMAMTEDNISGDEKILETISSLEVVESNLSDLFMETEKELKTLIEIIMRMPDEMQKFIWDDVFHFDNAKLKDFFDKVIELPYTYTLDESFESFCKLMKEINNEKEQTDNLGDNELILLHLELINELCSDEDKQLLMKYADTTEKGTITRDILIPVDMPLHNLHYVIQKLFGWQNSHLRAFHLDEKDYERLTYRRVKQWAQLVGILFRGLPEDENDQFWDDDYDDYIDGNFKIWLRKKYNGPYIYNGYTENYDVAKESVERLILQFPEIEVKESFHEYYERNKNKKDYEKESIKILKTALILDLTIEELTSSILFDSVFDELLEKIEVAKILNIKGDALADYEDIIKESNDDIPKPVTNKLIYKYDFGDNWIVEITRKRGYRELIENESIDVNWLIEAEGIVKEKHKPVCINKIGGFVMDDVGGMSGFTDFISTIYTSKDVEKRKSYRQWAKSMGWSNRKIELKKMF
jgi:hypothetical protein